MPTRLIHEDESAPTKMKLKALNPEDNSSNTQKNTKPSNGNDCKWQIPGVAKCGLIKYPSQMNSFGK